MTELARLGLYVDSSGVVKATKELQKMERQGTKTERSTGKATATITAGLKKVGAAAGIAAVAFAGFALTKAISDVKEFTQSISDLSAITGATGKDLEFYADAAKEIGRTTSLSASQAAKAFKLIASAKPDLLENAEALRQVTEDAVTLAEATGMELPAAAQALGGALNQFQIDASKSAEVINILAASSQLGTAEVEAVTDALRNAGPAANSLGIDLAETVAGIQGLAKAGRQGSDAGTGLRQVMLKLEKTADSTLQPSIVGLTGSLEELANRNLTNNELMEIFGEEGFAAATALLSTIDTVDSLNESLRGTDTAFSQAATRMDNLSGDTKELMSAIEGLSIEIGEGLEPALRKGTQALTDFINGLNEFLFGPKPDPFLDQKVSLRDLGEEMDRVGAAIVQYRSNIKNLEGGNAPDAVIEAQKKQLREYEAQLLSLAQKDQKIRQQIADGKMSPSSPASNESTDTTASSTNPVAAIQQAVDEAKPIDTSSLMWDWAPVRDEFKNELEGTMIDTQAIMDEWAPRLFEEFSEEAEAATSEMTEFAIQAARNMQDAMAGGFFDIMQGNFDDLGSSFKSTIDRMVADMLASQLMNFFAPDSMGGKGGWFSSSAGSSGNSFLGGLSDFLSFDGGGYTGDGARAGGIDGKGGMLAMVHPQETVVDHTKGQSTGSINIAVNISGMNNASDIRGAGRSVAQQAVNALNAAQRQQARNT